MSIAPISKASGVQPESIWPEGFVRIPDADWVKQPVDKAALDYDDAERAGIQTNLDPAIAQVLAAMDEGDLLVDYSCGTGVLTEKLLKAIDHPVGVLSIDPSPRLLRVNLEKFKDDERIAFRLLDWDASERRLQWLSEALEQTLLDRGANVLTSTNAIHLYEDLQGTFKSWTNILKPRGLVVITSANVHNKNANDDVWILGDVVAKINEVVMDLVQGEPAFERYRAVLEDTDAMRRHRGVREKVFVPVREAETYLDALGDVGLHVVHLFDQTITIPIGQFAQALSAYHEGALSWIGGSRRVEGGGPSADAIRDRVFLIRYALEKLFPGQTTFPCSWTYISCRR